VGMFYTNDGNFILCLSILKELSLITDAFYYYHMTISKSMVCIPVYDTWKINK